MLAVCKILYWEKTPSLWEFTKKIVIPVLTFFWVFLGFTLDIKGTVSRDGFDIWWHVWLILGLPFSKFFRFFKDFIMQKVNFAQLMRVCIGLIMLAAYFFHSR